MKRYLLGFLLAYGAAMLVFVGVLLLSLANWLFSDSPLWFDVLTIVLEVLPFLAVGEWMGHRAEKTVGKQKVWKGFGLLLAVMIGMALVQERMMDLDGLILLAGPCALMGGMLQAIGEWFGVNRHWDGLLMLLGPLLLPLVYQLGWHWGQNEL